MPDYRIYLIGTDGKIQRGENVTCADGDAALDTALGLVADYGLADVWMGTKRLYVISTDQARLRPWAVPQITRQGCSIVAFE